MDRFPEAVGKKQVFCVVNALPYARPPIDGIYFADAGLIGRFFQSGSMGVLSVPLSKDSNLPSTRTKAIDIWTDDHPTPEDFIKYLDFPPQVRVANAHYEKNHRAEMLSDKVIVKIFDLRRKDASVEEVLEAMAGE